MIEKKGLGVSHGIMTAKAVVFRHSEISVPHELAEDTEREKENFQRAVRSVLEDIASYKPKSDDERSMIAVHRSMVEDPEFTALVTENIEKKRYNALWAVEAAAGLYIGLLEKSGSEYFRERAQDLRDIERHLLMELSGKELYPKLSEPSILVADYLLPSEMFELDTSMILGICLDRGGKTSHVAILARSLEIPAVLGLGDISESVKNGDIVAIDGKEGVAVINPDKAAADRFRARRNAEARQEKALMKGAELPSVTTDGREIHLLCNIEGIEALNSVLLSGAEGIGLFRTEFLALHKDIFSNDELQGRIYSEVARIMGRLGPVTFRTYDLGGDKIAEELRTEEENPILGWRAVRLCMARKDIFRTQLISILRASALSPSVRIMFPMISGSEELQEVLSFLDEVKAECREKGIAFDENMKIGTMIEVPSAAITADIIADKVDFMSIGTNDLIQYTIAVDRGNDRISYLYRPLHPAVLRLLKHVVDSGERKGIPVSMCGEMAGEADYLPVLIGLGFRELSMSAHSILEVRNRVRSLSYESCRKLADKVLSLPDASSVENELREFNGKT